MQWTAYTPQVEDQSVYENYLVVDSHLASLEHLREPASSTRERHIA